MDNLYDFFDCESKEELYEKVKTDDKSVRSLVDFIDYSKSEIKNLNTSISSPDDFVEFVSDIQKPSNDEAVLVFVNTKSHPQHLNRVTATDEEAIKTSLKESLIANSQSMFVLYGKDVPLEEQKDLESYFDTISINTIDAFTNNSEEKYIISRIEGQRIPYNNFLESVAEPIATKSYTYEERNINKLEGYDEFASFYTEQELQGMDLIDDLSDIKESLKIGFQDDWQETFGLMTFDSNDDLVSMKELFKGSTNSAIIDMKVVAKEILVTEDVNNVIIFHNHPSGNSYPSKEDDSLTLRLRGVCETLQVDLTDHLVVGKENIYSYAEHKSHAVSYNEEYQDSIQRQKRLKKNDKQIELDL